MQITSRLRLRLLPKALYNFPIVVTIKIAKNVKVKKALKL